MDNQPAIKFLDIFGFHFHLTTFDMKKDELINLLSLALATLSAIFSIIFFLLKRKQEKKNTNDLHPFFSNKSAKELRKNYIATRLLTFTPSDFEELIQVHSKLNNKNTISFKQFYQKLIDTKTEDRFYFILGESGLGKTTFLMTLFLKYNKRYSKDYKIKLVPLGNPYSIEEIKKLLPEANKVILCIDGFDELTINNAQKNELQQLFDIIWTFRIVIISCRTQFFESQKEEPLVTKLPRSASTGFLPYNKFYISPFSVKEVKLYLRKKYWFFQFRRRRIAYQIVTSAMNLMIRPFLLKNIEYLLRNKSFLENAKYSLAIYKILIDQWIERDVNRISDEKTKENHKAHVLPMLKELAIHSFEKGISQNNYHLTGLEIENLALKYNINIEFIKVRSLLNRDDPGNVKFAHKSVMEYFVALEAVENEQLRKIVENNGSFDVANVFLDEHFFMNKITPIMQNCEGYFYENNVRDSKPLTNMNILSMYTITGLYITDFVPNLYLHEIFRLKRLKEVVFFLKWKNLELSDIYYVCYCHWLKCLLTINQFLSTYQHKVRIPEQWHLFYEMLYKTNTTEFGTLNSIDYVNFYSLATDIDVSRMRSHQKDVNFKDLEPGYNLEITELEPGIEAFLKNLFNNNCINIVAQLAELTTSKLRTLIGPRVSIYTFSNLDGEYMFKVDTILKKIATIKIQELKELDKLVGEFRNSGYSNHPRIRVYS